MFTQTPGNHLCGQKCPLCALESRADKRRIPLQQFIKDVSSIHDNKYDYSLITNEEYKNKKISIICPQHGVFIAKTTDHLYSKSGCPKCYSSKGEAAIRKILTLLNIQFIEQKTYKDLYHKTKRCKLKYDFYIPHLNLLIEYDGIQHFKPRSNSKDDIINFNDSQVRDRLKTEYTKNNGIKLLRIPYTQILNINNIITDQVKS